MSNVTKLYSNAAIIEGISLRVRRGEVVSLLGRSGVGKTTLMNVAAGLLSSDAGEVYLQYENRRAAPRRVSYMLQKDLLLPYKRIIDNVALPLTLRGGRRKDARAAAMPLFAKFGLDGAQLLYPRQLSGGMRQRAALLRTMFVRGEVMLLDEPFSALDAVTKRELHLWFLDMLKDVNLPVLLITHDVDEAIFLSDRVYTINGVPGRIGAEIVIDRDGAERAEFDLGGGFLRYKKEIRGRI